MADEGSEQQGQQGIDYDRLAEIIEGRAKAAEDSALKGYLRDQGLTGDEMAEAIKAFKDQRAAKGPDVEGMQASIADLQRQVEQANRLTTLAKVENAVIVEATKMGVDPKAVPYLTRMADLADVGTDGQVDPAKVAAAISKVLDDLPALRPSAEQRGFRIGGEGGKGEQAPTDDSKLRAAFGLK